MKKMDINAMKKMVGAFAFAATILGATNCFACGCQEPCVQEVKKVAVETQTSHGAGCPVPCVVLVREVTEPACAAELPYQLGTAVRFEYNGDTTILEIMGSKEEVAAEYVGAKRQAIREGRLVFVEEYHDIDTNFTSVKLVMKDNLEFYPGFVKSKRFKGYFDPVTKEIADHQNLGYEVVDFTAKDFFYENGGKAEAELAKKF